MISHAVLGVHAPAAAWSNNQEERRKALFAYFCEGMPFLVWDNIPGGTAISCPSIEKALTSHEYTDRILGNWRTKVVSAEAVMAFTGNNITARGDTATRALEIRLTVDRPDPENRNFKHPDPLAWTMANRGMILRALYMILLSNPRRRQPSNPAPETRFKVWWDLVGSAMEYAAGLVAAEAGDAAEEPVSFRKLFQRTESDNSQTESIVTVLEKLRQDWSSGFQASQIAAYMSDTTAESLAFKTALELADESQKADPNHQLDHPVVATEGAEGSARSDRRRQVDAGADL